MKRLMRKAEVDYNNFISELLNSNEYTPGEVDEIISSNPDCTFSGEVYRVIFFEERDIHESANKFQDLINSGQSDELFQAVVNDLIRYKGMYQSFSKSTRGVNLYRGVSSEATDFPVTIKMNVSNGLDIKALVDKYESNLDDFTVRQYRGEYQSEEEVIAKLEDGYEIVEADAIDAEIYHIVNGDEI